MRLAGLISTVLALAACTKENPGFASEPGASTSSAASSGSGSGGATSEVGPGSSTSQGPTTASEATTSTVGVTSTEGGSSTGSASTTSSGDSSSGDVMCSLGLDEDLVPLVPVVVPGDGTQISTAECAANGDKVIAGRMFKYADGFSIKKDATCMGGEQLLTSMKFVIAWPFETAALPDNACVTGFLSFHPEYELCYAATLTVFLGPEPMLGGSFGRKQFDGMGFGVVPVHRHECECMDCCGAGLSPDRYDFQLGMGPPIPEGAPPVVVEGYSFANLRSHIHEPPVCINLPKPDWLHFDWIAAKAPP